MTKRIRFGLIFVGPRPAADGSFLGDLGIKFIEGCSVGERHYVLFALERPRRPVDVLNAVYEYNRRCPTAELDEELLMASDGVLTSGGSAIMLLTPSCEESASQPSSSKHGPPLQVSSSASSGSRTKKHHSSSAAAALAKVAVFEKGHSFQSHEISRAIRTAKLAHLRVEAPPIPGELLLSAAASPGGGAPRQPMSCSPSGAVAIPTGYWSWGTSSPSSAQSLSGDEEGQRTPSVTVPSSPLPCDGRPRDGAPSSSSSSGIDSVAAPRRPASPLPGVAPSSAAPPSQGRAANKNKKKSGAGSRKRSGVDALESDLVQDSIRPSAPKRARGACCAPADVVGAAVNDRQEAGKEEEEGVPAPPPLPFSPLSGIMDGLTTGGGRSGEGGDGVPVAAAASAPSPLEAVDDPLASMELPDVRAMLEAAAAGEDEDEDAERPRRCGRQEGGEAEGGVETSSRAAAPMAAGGGARKEEEPFEEEQVMGAAVCPLPSPPFLFLCPGLCSAVFSLMRTHRAHTGVFSLF